MSMFTNDQWLIVILIFLLGLVVGMALMAGGKWKRRYRDESRRCETLEAENKRLRAEADELNSLRHAAARSDRTDAERVEAERLRADRTEADRIEAERIEVERREGDRREADRRIADRRDPG